MYCKIIAFIHLPYPICCSISLKGLKTDGLNFCNFKYPAACSGKRHYLSLCLTKEVAIKNLRAVYIVCLMAIAAGCSSLDIKYNYNPTTDFTRLKTYDWLSVPVKAEINKLDVERIKSAVNTQLEAKGLKMTSRDPHFLIAIHLGKKEKIEVIEWGYSYGPVNSYWYKGALKPGDISIYQYEEGTLILDFVDATTREMIWRSVAKAEVRPGKTPEKQEKQIKKAVQKILENFPPTSSN